MEDKKKLVQRACLAMAKIDNDHSYHEYAKWLRAERNLIKHHKNRR